MIRKMLLFLFSHRLLAIARWDLHFLLLRWKGALTGQQYRIRSFLSTREQPLFLNLGSGPRGLLCAQWINVDGYAARNVHFSIDLCRPFPFPDGLFAGVFCEHVLEHFSLEEGERIAREVLRTLAGDGVFRIVVPDAERLMRTYFENPRELIEWRGTEFETPMEVVNSCFRQRYEHQFLYDWETMERMLKRTGFRDVIRSSFRESMWNGALAIDDSKYERESLYVEARKRG